jgi:hydroxymethylbilane synthase
MNRALHGSCHVPVAAYAQLHGSQLHLAGLVGSASDGRTVRASAEGAADAGEVLGQRLATELLAMGAGAFL